MIAEAGLAALWLAAAMALLQLALAWSGVTATAPRDLPAAHAARRAAMGELLLRAARAVAPVQGALALAAFGLLIWLFVRSDMSVLLVVQNSHSAKPLLYKIAGAWGNHEGSMLLWVTVLSVAGAGVALFEKRLDRRTLVATLGAQALIALGFYAFLLIASNPFLRVDPPAADGLGLNPLLQDPGLAFHPPTLYFGYVGLSVAWSFAVGAMVMRDVGPAFARAMRPWVLGAWIFLTIGITAGSYWAYYELGWGGWWFWDPVENASLMPWLAATALLHSVSVLATRDGLRAWTLMLAVVAFSMSMIGTFLVRSGILVSVHAFAVDPTRGGFILGLLAFYIGGALALFGARVGAVKQGATFQLVSREGALVLNNLLLTVILGVVLIGTLYPLVAESMGVQLSVGAPFFNKATVPVALALMLATMAGPLLHWRRDRWQALARRMAVPGAAMLIVLLLLLAVAPRAGWAPVAGLVLAAGLAVASVAPLWKRKLRRTPLPIYGMVIAHLGIAVSVAGMAADSGFKQERLAAARIGETLAVGPFRITLVEIRPTVGDNWSALEARMSVTRGTSGKPFDMRPQQRFFDTPVTTTSEAAIATLADGQLYAVLGAPDGQDRWQVRLWWKPWVTLIWAGGGLIALGGLVALVGHARRRLRRGADEEGEAA
ncbi:MAG: heme lyase CcmF/NrfE family subunit [Pseudomonadota bacterium]